MIEGPPPPGQEPVQPEDVHFDTLLGPLTEEAHASMLAKTYSARSEKNPGSRFHAMALSSMFRTNANDLIMRRYISTYAAPINSGIWDYHLSEPDIEPIATEVGLTTDVITPGLVYFSNVQDSFLTYAATVREMSWRVKGYDAPAERTNYIIALTSERAAFISAMHGYEYLKKQPNIAGLMQEAGEKTMQSDKREVFWYGSLMAQYANGLRGAFAVHQHIDSIPGLESSEEIVEQTAALKEANDSLFEETIQLRAYAVKSAIAPRPVSDTEGMMKEWLVIDPRSLTEGADEAAGGHKRDTYHKFLPKKLAAFLGTSSRFVSSRPKIGSFANPHNEAAMIGIDPRELVEDPSASGFALALGEDGELQTLHGFHIDEYYKKLGTPEDCYKLELIRAEIVSIFHDMVTPVWAYELAEQEVSESRKKINAQKTTQKDGIDQKPSLRELVLARVKVIKLFKEEIINDLQKEQEVHTEVVVEEVGEKQKKLVEKYKVTGHVRRLPPHHRASLSARELALEEAGIELPEFGLTYEKTHEKGDLEPTGLGHRAKFRRGKTRELENRLLRDGDTGEVFRAKEA